MLRWIALCWALALCGCGPRFPALDITVPKDEASVERGRYLAEHLLICTTCHGARQYQHYGAPVKPGNYVVVLKVDDQEFAREITVAADPEFPAALLQEELEEQTRKQRQEFIE